MFSDNKDFYPTPEALFRQLVGSNSRHLNGRILEPSAGKYADEQAEVAADE